MNNKTTFLIVAVALAAAVAVPLVLRAQYNPSEEVQRLNDIQRDQTIQRDSPLLRGTGQPVPNKPSRSEEKLLEFKAIPTGYLYREFSVVEGNLGGQWKKPMYMATADFKDGWKNLDQDVYADTLKSGILDDKLKQTMYAPYYEGMKAACKAHVSAKAKIHVKAPDDVTDWRSGQKATPPHTIYRYLPFRCLAEGEEK